MTNVEGEIVTEQWIVDTYGQRNWVEVFYREAKGWLGLKEYQVGHKKSLLRHFILVSSWTQKEFIKAFYLGILCLYFYPLA